jgi:hypothetical protein
LYLLRSLGATLSGVYCGGAGFDFRQQNQLFCGLSGCPQSVLANIVYSPSSSHFLTTFAAHSMSPKLIIAVKKKYVRTSHIDAFSDLSIRWVMWSEAGFVPFVCMEIGTAVFKGVVKRVISNVIKYEVPTVRSVASHVTDEPVVDCKKGKSLILLRTCVLAYGGAASVSVGNPDPKANSSGTMQCRIVHPCAKPDLQIRIRH